MKQIFSYFVIGVCLLVICFITSQVIKATGQTDLPLLTNDTDFGLTGLKVDSVIRLHRLVTIPTYLIRRQLGVLPVSYRPTLAQKVRTLFQL